VEVTTEPLRLMTVGDLPAVHALEVRSFPVPWTPEMLCDELVGPGRTYVVADGPSGIVGYGGFMLIEGDAHIMTVAVDAPNRRSGVGTRLLLRLVDLALSAGAEHLTLELRVSNLDARRLYERFGFAPVGVRPRYYVNEDALVMWAVNVRGPDYTVLLDEIRQEVA
jgi:[ribosomal protein S18]-alanine N-acetyltransferase